MARYAIEHYYPRLSSSDMRWVLVEAMGRILPEVDLDMAAWTVKQLTARGMDIRLNTRLESVSPLGLVRLSDGEEFPSDTLVWTAGTKPNPLLAGPTCPSTAEGGWSASPRCRCRECPTPGPPVTWPPCPTSPRATAR